MNLVYLAYRNMVSKPLNLVLSLMLLLLSVSLVTFALQMSQQVDQQLNKNIAPFDMVVGAKGSPLQLVLASVLHIDNPTGNIKMKEASLVERNPLVQTAIPISYGDNYKGYRILGTKVEYLNFYNAKLNEGRLFEKSFEAVVGSGVAKKLNLKLGDTFVSSHGLADAGHAHDEHPYTVVGVLKPTGTVVDQLLIANLESIWDAHDHGDHDDHEHEDDHDHEGHNHDDDHDHEDHEGHEGHDHSKHEIDENTEITSLLVKFKSPLGMVQIPRSINENTNMQAALPGFEINRLMNLLGSGVQTINWIALVILLVSGLSIFISLLKTIRERKQELALLRTYGLNTGQLLTLALLEGSFLAVIGFVLGWLLGRLGIAGVSGYMESSYGYGLQVSGPDMTELILLVLIFAVAMIASLLASLSIFKLDVAKTLSDA
jgi:putative ABC transport system permease protein